jgi:hypothetical protein
VSLAITVITPEGIVQAADSRVSIPVNVTDGVVSYSHFDNATKLLTFDEPHNYVSVTTYGAGTIGSRTAHSFVKEFQKTLPITRLTIKKFAEKLQAFYKAQWDAVENNPQTSPMIFQVAGINSSQQFGELYIVSVPGEDPPQKIINNGDFSLYYGGDKSTVDRLIQGRDLRIDALILEDEALNGTHESLGNIFTDVAERHMLPLGSYALQDAIDLARFLIDTTSNMQKLSLNVKTVGGAIDVCCVTKSGACEVISKKKIG